MLLIASFTLFPSPPDSTSTLLNCPPTPNFSVVLYAVKLISFLAFTTAKGKLLFFLVSISSVLFSSFYAPNLHAVKLNTVAVVKNEILII